MNQNPTKYIKLIKKLEPVFIKAGKRSVLLQNKAIASKKFTTGTYEVDVVTNADIEIQEMILSELSKTKLVDCRLVAEEKTKHVDKFNSDGELLLEL